jgi:hypothetical protein
LAWESCYNGGATKSAAEMLQTRNARARYARRALRTRTTAGKTLTLSVDPMFSVTNCAACHCLPFGDTNWNGLSIANLRIAAQAFPKLQLSLQGCANACSPAARTCSHQLATDALRPASASLDEPARAGQPGGAGGDLCARTRGATTRQSAASAGRTDVPYLHRAGDSTPVVRAEAGGSSAHTRPQRTPRTSSRHRSFDGAVPSPALARGDLGAGDPPRASEASADYPAYPLTGRRPRHVRVRTGVRPIARWRR